MAKKKPSPKKKSCSKKSCNKKCPAKNCDKIEKVEPKIVSKTDYFFEIIKKAFGYE